MGISDDYGKPRIRQYRVIETYFDWMLLYDQHDDKHQFRIVREHNHIILYSGISLEEAKRRFSEISQAA